MAKLIRNIICFILLGVMILAFVYLGTKKYQPEKIKPSDSQIMQNYYSKLDKNNVFKIIKGNEVNKFFEKESGIIFICIKNSEFCNTYAKILNETAKELKISSIKFYDIYEDRHNNSYFYQKFVTRCKEYLLKNDEGNYQVLTPLLFVVNNGTIIGVNNDSSIIIGSKSIDDYFTESKKTELKATLKQLLSLNKNQLKD